MISLFTAVCHLAPRPYLAIALQAGESCRLTCYFATSFLAVGRLPGHFVDGHLSFAITADWPITSCFGPISFQVTHLFATALN